MKDARFTTAQNLKKGDKVSFINVPHFGEDKRLSWDEKEVISIEPTKSGKRVTVIFNGSSVGTIGWQTPLQIAPEKFWKELEAERGWK